MGYLPKAGLQRVRGGKGMNDKLAFFGVVLAVFGISSSIAVVQHEMWIINSQFILPPLWMTGATQILWAVGISGIIVSLLGLCYPYKKSEVEK